MFQNLRLTCHTFSRKWKKFRADPEKFFLDSRKPLLPELGRWMVRRRENGSTLEDDGTCPEARQLPVLAPIHACPGIVNHGISVVVPIYNAPDHVQRCLNSLLKHTSMGCRFILIDDCSNDPGIAEILADVQDHESVTVIRNDTNLGYTATVNKGIALAGRDDVVLLNSDTQVGPGWLQNLHVAAYQDGKTASVTPLSNNAGAFSAPVISCCNELPEDCCHGDLCRALSQAGPVMFDQAPTGNGFCLYLRRDALDAVGTFDEQTFPRGYCEENDWCQRAIQACWHHVIDGRTYVLHHQAASFGPERSRLLQANRRLLDDRFPDYTRQVQNFLRCPEMEQMRQVVRSTFVKAGSNGHKIRPRILFVISSETGGTPQTNADLMQGLQKDIAPFLLVCNSRVVQLRDCSQDEPVLLEEVRLQSPIRAPGHTSLEYDRHVGSMLITHGIEMVHIRHLSWHSLNLPWVAKSLGIPVVLSFHDFYAVCPNTQLLDENAIHCQGRCTDTPGDCEAPLWGRQEKPQLKHDWVFTWRKTWQALFEHCDAFVTTCHAARDLLTSVYPQLKEKPFPVIPHGRDFTSYLRPGRLRKPDGRLRILFPGNLNRAKGMDLILALKELDADDRLEIHLLGKVATAYQSRLNGIVFHGPYSRDGFQARVEQIRPHCIGLFSLWPETYSHTLTEAWAAGIPVVATPFGALKERLEQCGGGWVLPSTQPQEVYEALLGRLQDQDEFAAKLEQVQQWQEAWAKNYGISEMAHQYRCLYQKATFI